MSSNNVLHRPTLYLLGVTVAVAALYLRILQPLLLPLLLAGVTAVLFFPSYLWMCRALAGRRRVAAAIATVLILLLFMLPLGAGVTIAGLQLVDATQEMTDEMELSRTAEEFMNASDDKEPSRHWMRELRSRFREGEIEQIRNMATTGMSSATEMIYQATTSLVANLFAFVVGLVVYLLALYYFLADHEAIADCASRLSPLDREDDRAMWRTFVQVCRGVLLGNVMAAAAQAVLNGVGFAVLGVEQAVLLGFLTFFFSLIPFVGAGAVWGCVAIGLAWNGEYVKAGILVAFGALIVSLVDNVIRAYVFRDNGRLHPLIALVSILGAVRFVGLWGIVVGPVVAAFLYSLLERMHDRMTDRPPRLEVPDEVVSDAR